MTVKPLLGHWPWSGRRRRLYAIGFALRVPSWTGRGQSWLGDCMCFVHTRTKSAAPAITMEVPYRCGAAKGTPSPPPIRLDADVVSLSRGVSRHVFATPHGSLTVAGPKEAARPTRSGTKIRAQNETVPGFLVYYVKGERIQWADCFSKIFFAGFQTGKDTSCPSDRVRPLSNGLNPHGVEGLRVGSVCLSDHVPSGGRADNPPAPDANPLPVASSQHGEGHTTQAPRGTQQEWWGGNFW